MTNKELEKELKKVNAKLNLLVGKQSLKNVVEAIEDLEKTKEDPCKCPPIPEFKSDCKPKFEVGKWYMQDDELFCCTSIENEKVYGYGFSGQWIGGPNSWDDAYKNELNFKEADKETVEKRLIKEAKKRGFVTGVRIKGLTSGNSCALGKSYTYHTDTNALDLNYTIFIDGKWAEIIENKFEIAGHEVKVSGKNVDIGGAGYTKKQINGLYQKCEEFEITDFNCLGNNIKQSELKSLVDYIK